MSPIFFKNSLELRRWLKKNHQKETELWIGFYKKASGKVGITNEEALNEALCFGWIDGIRKGIDKESYCNRYTPRTSKSRWSKINTKKAQDLIDSGLMQPSGLKAIEDAKADGRWEKAYASSKNAVIPDDFLNELKKNKKAQAFYKTLKKQDLFFIVFRLENSKKPETREKWIKKIVEMLASEETFQR